MTNLGIMYINNEELVQSFLKLINYPVIDVTPLVHKPPCVVLLRQDGTDNLELCINDTDFIDLTIVAGTLSVRTCKRPTLKFVPLAYKYCEFNSKLAVPLLDLLEKALGFALLLSKETKMILDAIHTFKALQKEYAYV